jgi:hypothetical protein
MRNVQQGSRRVQQRPMTVSDVARHVSRLPTPCYAQVRIKGAVLCARVLEVGTPSSPKEFFKVATDLGDQWVSGWNARLCNGDGRCTCESAAGAGKRSAAPAAPSPLGNTGTTWEAGA